MAAETVLKSGLVPDAVIRFFIRRRLAKKIKEEQGKSVRELLPALSQGPLAVSTEEANEQHYELPPEFFEAVLGAHLKYSCGLWPEGVADLDASEKAMLDIYLQRARLKDGQDVLELGCGWGSLSLYMAEKFPNSRITGVSNSNNQRLFIEARAKQRGLKNLTIRTANINELQLSQPFDRIVSIEMFEHMRNYKELLRRVSSWLKPEGLAFVHIFCHEKTAYLFTSEGKNDFMGRYFFTGGLMPSFDLFDYFPSDIKVVEKWAVNGQHYEKTSNAWLEKMDASRPRIFPVFEKTYGGDAAKWWVYWRVFFMACAELFGYNKGREWLVGHYLLERSKK